MEYSPLHTDAFGLSDYFKKDLIQHLDSIMPSPGGQLFDCQTVSYDRASDLVTPSVNLNFCDSWDSDQMDLVKMRSDAFEEFRVNGIEQDLDEVDVYQFRLREMSVARPEGQVRRRYPSKKSKKTKSLCVFCKNNNEQPAVYQSHILKDSEGRVCCPVLRKYVCPICGVSGDNAHTIRYCPENTERELSLGVGLLMRSPHFSAGRRNRRTTLET